MSKTTKPAVAQATVPMEYKAIKINIRDEPSELAKNMNEAAAEGWVFVALDAANLRGVIMQRPRKETDKP